MQVGGIAFVLAETIFGKTGAEVTHHHVAGHLCDHAGGGDAQAVAVPLDNRGLGKRKRENRQTVDQDMIRWTDQRCERGAHGFVRGAQDIDLIDFNVVYHANRPDHF